MAWISVPLFAVPNAPADAVPTCYEARRVSADAATRLLADPAHGCHASTPEEIAMTVALEDLARETAAELRNERDGA
jgi:hypothetical protein